MQTISDILYSFETVTEIIFITEIKVEEKLFA